MKVVMRKLPKLLLDGATEIQSHLQIGEGILGTIMILPNQKKTILLSRLEAVSVIFLWLLSLFLLAKFSLSFKDTVSCLAIVVSRWRLLVSVLF